MPKELRHENEIKTVLDYQLVNLRKYNMEPVPKCSYYLVPEFTEYQTVAVDSFRKYPWVPSKGWDTEPDMEENGATGGNHPLTEFQFQIIMQKMEQMELEFQWKRLKSEDNVGAE